MNRQQTSLLLIAILLIVTAAFSRLVLYPHNFSPIIAMAIFSGAIIKDRKWSFIVPLAAMFLSDLVFEFSGIAQGFWGWGQVAHYGIYAFITFFAFNFRKWSIQNIAFFTLSGSVLFFLLSNTTFFFIDNRIYHLYQQNTQGYINCLIAAVPFFKTAVIADMTYSIILFGSFFLAQRYTFKSALPGNRINGMQELGTGVQPKSL